jgi:hypothetical protein
MQQDTVFRFTHKDSYVKGFVDNEMQRFEIITGQITNDAIGLTNGIRVGMSAMSLLHRFFDSVPPQTLQKISYVRIESALLGSWHTYKVANNKVVSIVFDSDFQFDKE